MNAKKIAANRSLNGRTSCCALSAARPDSAMPASSAPTAAENFATSATPAIEEREAEDREQQRLVGADEQDAG